jgi:succinate dehydrogenase/fumarate reductase-like Fe-S protein
MAEDKIELRVARYRPDKDVEPGWQEYEVPLREEWTVLTA